MENLHVLKKLEKLFIVPGLILSTLTIGIATNIKNVDAYSYITQNSYNNLNTTNKAIIDNLHNTYSKDTTMSGNNSYPQSAEVIYASPGTISVSSTGKTPSSYQWTAWYNANNKDFAINKSLTSGNYQVGVPTRTSSRTLQTDLKRVGYYKYLSDPIYSEIRLKATQNFSWVTKKKNSPRNEFRQYNKSQAFSSFGGAAQDINNTLSQFSVGTRFPVYSNSTFKSLAKSTSKYKNAVSALKNSKTSKIKTISFSYSDFQSKTVNTTVNVRDHVVVDNSSQKTLLYGNISIQIHYTGSVVLTKPSKTSKTVYATFYPKSYLSTNFYGFYDITYKNYSKTIEIANTSVARNVSATELSKYASFKLVSKNGGTGAVNTSVSKSSAGWWGGYNPPYHQGNSTTSDSSGTYYYWSNSSGGSNSQSLRSLISQTEKVHSFKATATNQTTTHKYTLYINPNGGTYNGNGGITNVKQAKASTYTVALPVRDGYQFAGWDFSGGGTWNPATNKYVFNTGDATLTAKWIPNDDYNGQYTLTIDPNGGKYKGKSSKTKITKNKGETESINNPIRSGYTFIGWKVVEGNSACFSQGTNTSAVRFYDNLTIQAQWIKNKEGSGTVIIDPNGGTYAGSTDNKTITGNTGETTFITKPTRPGYVFTGWEVINLGSNKFNGSTFTFVQGTTTLKARWELLQIPSCVIGGTGANACPGDEEVSIWFYLTKNLD